MAPTAAQSKAVYNQWSNTDKDAFVLAFYKDLFDTHSDYRGMFKKLRGDPTPVDGGWKQQLDITRDALDAAIQLAHGDLAGLRSSLRDLSLRHVKHSIGQRHFQAAKPILLNVAKRTVGGADPAAWEAVLFYICDNIQ